MNIRDRSAIHHAAGQSLADAKGDPKKILLIYLGIVTALSLAVAAASMLLSNRIDNTGGLGNMGLRSALSTAKTVLTLAQSIIFLGLEMGYTTTALHISRGERISEQILYGGFHRFFPLLRAKLMMGFTYMGLAMLAGYLSIYIFLMLPMAEDFYEILTPVMESATVAGSVIAMDDATFVAAADAMMPVMWIFAVAFLLLFIPTYYRYKMVIYRLIDHSRPGAMRAIRESSAIMRRNRFALLKLDLQFWWFYALQGLIVAVCYGDVLLPMFGITLPWSDTVGYFVFLCLSLALQFVVYYFFMNKVSVTYAVAYQTLLPKKEEPKEEPEPAAVPWENQY